MKIDAALAPTTLSEIPPIARAAEAIGFDTLWVSETQHDPFLPGALIAEHTQTLGFGTAVAIAFARSPATLAYTAWDLAQASSGRFILGLGTQVKAHIERRFGMPWPASPVGKLRAQMAAVRAFWQTWQTGAPLNLRGEDYKLTLMTPFFNPGPIAHPEIPIYIAGVNTGLARLAGEAADGFVVHPLHTVRYLQEVLLPAIQAGASDAGRQREVVKISVSAFTVTNPAEAVFVRQQIAFYASTPSYRAVMALHGWEPEAEMLSALASRKKWEEMPAIITDEMLETFAVVADPSTLAVRLGERYHGLANHLSLYLPFIPGERDVFWGGLVAALKGSG
jgi:probable F420-dependent oxidoreductase